MISQGQTHAIANEKESTQHKPEQSADNIDHPFFPPQKSNLTTQASVSSQVCGITAVESLLQAAGVWSRVLDVYVHRIMLLGGEKMVKIVLMSVVSILKPSDGTSWKRTHGLRDV